MPYSIRCKACSSSFAIPDEIWDKRVRGRVATLKCRSCKADIEVDGTKEGISQPAVAAPDIPKSQLETADSRSTAEPPTPQMPAAAPAASAPAASAPAASAPAASAPTASNPNASSPTANAPAVREQSPPVVLPSAGRVSAGNAAGSRNVVHGRATDETKHKSPLSPTPPVAAAVSTKPVARSSKEVAAADAGWSMMPPPGDMLATVANNGEHVAMAPTPVIAPEPTKPAPAQSSAAASAALGDSDRATSAFASVPPDAIFESAPPDPDLWVVSYGEDDDRELTEKQIAADLAGGKITLSTIVWQEGMDEWLPISGVKVLAKYAPAQKLAPSRQARGGLGTKALAQQPRSTTASAGTAQANKSGSAVPRQAATVGARALSNANDQSSREAEAKELDPATSVAAETKPAKAPPALTRASEVSRPELGGTKNATPASRVPVGKAAPAARGVTDGHTGGKPPPIARRPSSGEGAAPWELQDDAVEEVLTSAPDLGPAPKVQRTPAAAAAAPLAPAPAVALASTAAVSSKANAPPAEVAKSVPSQRPSAKASMRPPKPVETATSLVMRRDASSGKDLLITDEDFMAMQRRFPKWALPVSIAGGLAVTGLIVFAALSGEEPPPLPVAPVVGAANTLRENPANQAQPRHPQPNLDAMPTGTGVTSEEKDFAKLFAQSATKTNGTFDAQAAERAVLNVMELASRCRVAPEPSGPARVVVTFSTAGQVLSVQVGSPYANTATGKCVEKVLRGVKTRPFQGEPGRLPLTVPIH